ncbi:36774_t:CDS:2, partial [Gigaspora margarita]
TYSNFQYMAGNAIHRIFTTLESQATYLKSLEIRNSFIQDNHIASKVFCWPQLEELRIVNNNQKISRDATWCGKMIDNHINGANNVNNVNNVNIVKNENKESNDGIGSVNESPLTHINLNIQIHSAELSTILRTIATYCSQNLLHFDSSIDFHSIPLLFNLLKSCPN